jgi:DNA-binding MarR family transcriptional regulator
MTTPSESAPRVTPEQLELWRTFVRAHARILRRLEADLMDNHDLPLTWFEVMARLAEDDDHKLRMSELAELVMLSPSGLTRLVDRMVAEGLLRREQAERDGRGYYAVLTDAGYEALRGAMGTHLRGVQEYVIQSFTPEELRDAGDFFRRLDRVDAGVQPA